MTLGVTSSSSSGFDRHARTAYSAATILRQVLAVVPGIRSVVDVGCGVGTWLSTLGNLGSFDILGIDGDWIARESLLIRPEQFVAHDLRTPLAVKRRFDLALSLEVGEHIAAADAPQFVQGLCELSNTVLFSAAVPGQAGLGHINEQWPSYWSALFASRGFVALDGLRLALWDDRKIPYWYRQNTVLYVKDSTLSRLRVPPGWRVGESPSLVHPELYDQTLDRQRYPSTSLHLLGVAVRQYLGRRFGRL